MLRDIKELEGYTIQATDGDLGRVHEFYFDEASGTIRYLVVDTGGWLTGRQVLIGTEALGQPNHEDDRFPVNLTKAQIENSPPIDSDRPVSRQMEVHLRDYFGWQPYWQTSLSPAPWPTMGNVIPTSTEETVAQQNTARTTTDGVTPDEYDPYLRSSREVVGYDIEALDGNIGHVETFLVDDGNWRIRYLIVDTRNWLPGKKVLVAPEWMDRINWNDKKVHVSLTQDVIKNSPEYDKSMTLSPSYEEELFDHYNREPMF